MRLFDELETNIKDDGQPTVMKAKEKFLFAMGLEFGALAFQKLVKKHPLKCSCKFCLAIEISIPGTVGGYLLGNKYASTQFR